MSMRSQLATLRHRAVIVGQSARIAQIGAREDIEQLAGSRFAEGGDDAGSGLGVTK
jgi:hypothetical protein